MILAKIGSGTREIPHAQITIKSILLIQNLCLGSGSPIYIFCIGLNPADALRISGWLAAHLDKGRVPDFPHFLLHFPRPLSCTRVSGDTSVGMYVLHFLVKSTVPNTYTVANGDTRVLFSWGNTEYSRLCEKILIIFRMLPNRWLIGCTYSW